MGNGPFPDLCFQFISPPSTRVLNFEPSFDFPRITPILRTVQRMFSFLSPPTYLPWSPPPICVPTNAASSLPIPPETSMIRVFLCFFLFFARPPFSSYFVPLPAFLRPVLGLFLLFSRIFFDLFFHCSAERIPLPAPYSLFLNSLPLIRPWLFVSS